MSRKKEYYITPESCSYDIRPAGVLCLSLTGGTEGMDSSDLPEVLIDDPLVW